MASKSSVLIGFLTMGIVAYPFLALCKMLGIEIMWGAFAGGVVASIAWFLIGMWLEKTKAGPVVKVAQTQAAVLAGWAALAFFIALVKSIADLGGSIGLSGKATFGLFVALAVGAGIASRLNFEFRLRRIVAATGAKVEGERFLAPVVTVEDQKANLVYERLLFLFEDAWVTPAPAPDELRLEVKHAVQPDPGHRVGMAFSLVDGSLEAARELMLPQFEKELAAAQVKAVKITGTDTRVKFKGRTTGRNARTRVETTCAVARRLAAVGVRSSETGAIDR